MALNDTIQRLASAANALDESGYMVEANTVTDIMLRLSQSFLGDNYSEWHGGEDDIDELPLEDWSGRGDLEEAPLEDEPTAEEADFNRYLQGLVNQTEEERMRSQEVIPNM